MKRRDHPHGFAGKTYDLARKPMNTGNLMFNDSSGLKWTNLPFWGVFSFTCGQGWTGEDIGVLAKRLALNHCRNLLAAPFNENGEVAAAVLVLAGC